MLTYHCYDFNEEWFMLELALDIGAAEINWRGFEVPEEGVDSLNWQAPYLEQYLNADGTQRICGIFEKPKNDEGSCRVAFYIFKNGMPLIRTPLWRISPAAGRPRAAAASGRGGI